jgi:hypothetical protein
MALASTKEAIGAVTQMLQTKLMAKTSVNVSIGRPEASATALSEGAKLNLFLYQVGFDGSMRNFSIDDGQPPPLWIALHYLITAFDAGRDSDSIDAHKLLGTGLAALQELNFMRPNPASLADAPLVSNPEPLKVTFDSADVEMLSKIMQGADEKYRVSAAFQVRPVMLMPEALPSYAPAVLSVGPPASPGVVVLPSMGPRLETLDPEKFEAGQTLTLTGIDIAGANEVCVGGSCFAPALVNGDLSVTVPLGTTLSAGSHPVTAVRILPSGRRFSSNALLGHLLPTLATAAHGPLTPAGPQLHGDLTITGNRLGGPQDGIFIGFYRDGACALVLETAGVAAQNTLTATVTAEQALDPGTYFIILRVNGEQAIHSPAVDWT